MTDKDKAVAAGPEEPVEVAVGKEAIYIQISELIKEKTGKRVGKTGGREIFDLVTAAVFATAAEAGAFRFNGGFGSFHLKTYGAGSRRLPSGQETTFGERQKLRYEEGVVVKALVANGGNLEEALKVRGSRAKPAADPNAGKGDETPQAEAAEAPAEAEGDVDLD